VTTQPRPGPWARTAKARFIVGFLALPLTLYVIFAVSPYLQAFSMAMTNWRGFNANPQFVGLDNFRRMFADEHFWQALAHNGLLLLLLPVITIAIALFFAFLLNAGGSRPGLSGIRGSGFYKVVFFFPQVLALAVVGAFFAQVFRPDSKGMINGPLSLLGIGPIGFVSEPELVLWSVLAVMVWHGVGFYLVLFSAGMAASPAEIYEAAQLDGAAGGHLFRRITLPLLRDTVQVAWVYLGIVAIDAFAVVWVMTPEHGGPDYASTVLAAEVYRNAFLNARVGYASALGVALFVLSLGFAILSFRVSRRDRIEF